MAYPPDPLEIREPRRLSEAIEYVQSEYVDVQPGEPDWAIVEVLKAAQRVEDAEQERTLLAEAIVNGELEAAREMAEEALRQDVNGTEN